jgi:choline dehydrogenase-like flavoprotein
VSPMTVVDEAEYIVIGTGAGGGTVARHLAMDGRDVVVIERGRRYNRLGSYLTLGHMFWNKGAVFTKEGYACACAIMTGGSTVVTAGCLTDPPSYLKEKWNIDLSEELEETQKELGVQKLPENLCGAASMKILEAANGLGYQWERINKMIDPTKCREGCAKCVMGCKHGAKWTSSKYLDEARNHGARLYENIEVQAVTHQNGKATGVWGIDKKGGGVQFGAEKIIAAAGGMNTAKILQRSGLWGAGDGFFMDPVLMVYGVYEGDDLRRGAAWDVPMSVGSWEFHDSEGILLATFLDPRLVYYVNGLKSHVGNIRHMGQYKKMFGIMIKARDEVCGRVFLDGTISKPLTQADMKKLDMGGAIATEILIKAGCAPKSIHYAGYGGSHPGGTIRLGEMVDGNLETQIQGLYVGDASVFPESLGQPAVGSIICMAKRLSKYLEAEG